MEDKNGIYIMFCGGLGNKMFQIAAGYAASKKYNCALYIPRIEDTNHHGDKVNYSDNIFKHFGVHLSQLNYPSNYIRNDVYQFMISTEAYSLDNLQIPITFNQYFQYYPPLKIYENDIRYLFKEGLMSYKIDYPTFILDDNKNFTSSFVCPINALCLGSQFRTDGSGFIRGPNVTCAYQIIREACIARWNTTNPFYSILQVPNVINGSVISKMCSLCVVNY